MSFPGFGERKSAHDAVLPTVKAVFQAAGFLAFDFGSDYCDAEAFRKHLIRQPDDAAWIWRYRPDLLVILPFRRTVLCEVKSDSSPSPNFSVEFAAYQSARWWDRGLRSVVFIGVDPTRETVVAAWVSDVPTPSVVFVPKRWDWEEQQARVLRWCPQAQVRLRDYTGKGSGTPFILIPKIAPFWISLDDFVQSLACVKREEK